MPTKSLLIFCVFLIIATALRAVALSPPDPLVNSVQGQGMLGLNFYQSGNGEQIAFFIINSNSATGFEIKIQLTNRGKFKNGSNEIPMTSLVLNKLSGVLGAGLIEPVNLDVLAVVSSGGEFVWDPRSNPETPPESETINYMVELKADWADPAGKLAGFYFENISFTISVSL